MEDGEGEEEAKSTRRRKGKERKGDRRFELGRSLPFSSPSMTAPRGPLRYRTHAVVCSGGIFHFDLNRMGENDDIYPLRNS